MRLHDTVMKTMVLAVVLFLLKIEKPITIVNEDGIRVSLLVPCSFINDEYQVERVMLC